MEEEMRRKLATCFLIGLTAVGCARRSSDKGLGAGADSAGLRDSMPGRDTSMTSPATGTPASPGNPSVTPGGSTSGSNPTDTSTRHRKRDQTQSGVTDKSGTSTLGAGVTRTRPDQNQPVMAKGDTLSGNSITDMLNRRQLEKIQGNDTMPTPRQDTSRSRTDSTMMPMPMPTDTTRSRSDSTRPLGTDTLHRWRSDSVRPTSDSARRDSVPQ
jgi:hypothetical protein